MNEPNEPKKPADGEMTSEELDEVAGGVQTLQLPTNPVLVRPLPKVPSIPQVPTIPGKGGLPQ